MPRISRVTNRIVGTITGAIQVRLLPVKTTSYNLLSNLGRRYTLAMKFARRITVLSILTAQESADAYNAWLAYCGPVMVVMISIWYYS